MTSPAATEATRARVDLGIAAGLLALVAIAFSISEWADWLIEINEERASGANGSIIGRVLEMVALAAVVTATAVGALVARARGGAGALGLGFASLVVVGALVGLHWHRGWYAHLEHGGPLLALILSAAQGAMLVWAGSRRPRDTTDKTLV